MRTKIIFCILLFLTLNHSYNSKKNNKKDKENKKKEEKPKNNNASNNNGNIPVNSDSTEYYKVGNDDDWAEYEKEFDADGIIRVDNGKL